MKKIFSLMLAALCLSMHVYADKIVGSTTLPSSGKPEHVYTMVNGNGAYVSATTAPVEGDAANGLFAFYAVPNVSGAYYIYSHSAKKWLTYDKAASYSSGKGFVKLSDSQGNYFRVNNYSGDNYEISPYTTSGSAQAIYLNWYQGVGANSGTALGLWTDSGSADAGSRYTFVEQVIVERIYTISVPDGVSLTIGGIDYADGSTISVEGSLDKSKVSVTAPEGKFAVVSVDDVNNTITVNVATLPVQSESVPYVNAWVYPKQQDNVGVASISEEEGVYTLSNNVLSASYMKVGNALYFAGSKAMDLVAGTEPFTVAFGTGDNVPASAMTLKSVATETLTGNATAIGGAHHFNGVQLVANYEYTYKGTKIAIVWRAVLRDGSHYLRTEMELTGVDAVDMYNVIPMIYNVDTEAAGSAPKVVGNTRGAVLMSDKIFAGLETPTAYNTVGEATGDSDPWTLSETKNASLTASSWTQVAAADVPKRVEEATGANYPNVYAYDMENVTLKEGQKVSILVKYTSGNHRLNFGGAVLLDANGAIAAVDYHSGYSGGQHSNNTFTFLAPYDGTFAVRVFVENKTESIDASSTMTVDIYTAKAAAKAAAQPATRGVADGSIPGDNIMRYYRLAIPVTLTAYQEDLGSDYNNVKAFWQECEDFVNNVFVPLGICFDVVVDERLVMTARNSIDDNIYNAPSYGTELTNDAIGSDTYDVGMWVMHRDVSEENSGLSVEGGVYDQLTKSSGYSKTDKWVVAHEIGHLFGAGHTTQDEGSLMDNAGEFFSYPSIKKIRESYVVESYPSGKTVSNAAPVFDAGRMKDVYCIPQGAFMAIPVYATDAEGHIITYSSIGCSSSTVDNVKEGGALPHFASFAPQTNNIIDYRPVYSADVIYDDFYYTMSGTAINEMESGSYSIAFLANDVPVSTDYATLYENPFYSNYSVWDATVRIIGGTPFEASISPAKNSYSAGEQVTVQWGVNNDYFTDDSRLRITMSTDYGKTFDHVLSESVPATDGSCTVVLPNVNVGNIDVNFLTATRSMRAGIIRVEEIDGVAYTLTTIAPDNGGGFTVTGGGNGGETPEPPTVYTITVAASPADGGTATVSVGSGDKKASLQVNAGDDITLQAVANNGYSFVNWTKNGNVVSTDAIFCVSNINESAYYTANFELAKEGAVINTAIVGIQGLWSRNTTLAAGDTWKVAAVVGLVAQDGTQSNANIRETQKRRSFLAYSERERAVPWRTFPHYNSWYELNINRNNAAPGSEHTNFTAEDILGVMRQWKEKYFDKYGEGIAAFVIDDGWDNYGPWTFHSGFPNEMRDMASLAKEMNSGIGAWLGPVGGYGQSGNYRRAYWNENNRGGMQLSNPAYYEAFLTAANNLVCQQDGVAGFNRETDNYVFFKFDGISGQFSAVGPDAGDTGNENAEGIIRLEQYVRENMREDIFFNTTVGTWASPFWYQISDATWRQENDHDHIGNNSINRENWITYRDRLVYQNYVQNSPICPINTLMTHGFILSEDGPPANDSRDYNAVLRELRCAFVCGSGIVELYTNCNLMNSINNGKLWEDVAECVAWQKKNADVLPDAHWVGGNPWNGSAQEVYGWASWNGVKATLALRNGSNSAQTYTFTLRQALEIPKNIDGEMTFSKSFKVQDALQGFTEGEPIDYDTELTVTLPASSVFAFDGSNIEEDVVLNWTSSTSWTDVDVKDYTSDVMNNNALAYGVSYIENNITVNGARSIEVALEYTSGNCALNIRGIELLDTNGNIVAGDYHVGKAGSPSTNNVYTVKIAEAGTYKVRCYATFDDKNRKNATNGTITIAFESENVANFSKDVTFAAEYATLHLGYKVAIPEGVEAYCIADDNLTDGGAALTQITGVIPAATPVIIKNTGAKDTYTFAYTVSEAEELDANGLRGSIADRYIVGNAYVLGLVDGEACLVKAELNRVNNTAFKNNANKVYLPVADGAALSASLRLDFGGTTGIEKVEIRNEKSEIYDLQGRRVNETAEKGIYIVNGKKVLVK